MALELAVVGLRGEVPDGLAAHRGLEGSVVHHRRGVRGERSDRRRLERDGPDALACVVDVVHLRGVVLAVADDRSHFLPAGGRILDAPEGVVVDDALDEVVERRYIGERDGEVPDRRSVYGLLHEVCHGLVSYGTTLPGCA